MTGRQISTANSALHADLLDHSREFVEIVYRSAPQEYLSLLDSERFAALLNKENAFNYGKLFAYAESSDSLKPFRYWFRQEADTNDLLLVGYFGYNHTILCALDRHYD